MTAGVSIVSYGGGTNSTAMLIGMALRGERPPHAILFADTGGERPETYAFIDTFSVWLERQGFPRITLVHRVNAMGEQLTLEMDCLDKHALPSIAYGWKTCSQKFKIQPQDKWCNNDAVVKAEWKAGRKVVKVIGYDADEPHRAKDFSDDKYSFRFPLIEWDWGREECVRAIRDVQLPQPGKSSCFYCPSMRPSEIKALDQQHPDLLRRALALEANADLTSLKGLGRDWSWREVMAQGELFPGSFVCPARIPCGCYDGEAAE